jgi:hypothetical protein
MIARRLEIAVMKERRKIVINDQVVMDESRLGIAEEAQDQMLSRAGRYVASYLICIRESGGRHLWMWDI